MLRSIFGKGKKKGGKDSGSSAHDDSIRAAKVGDVVSIAGLRLEYDDLYFFVEKIDRYATNNETWYEALCVEGENQVWLDWSDGYELAITATDDPDPKGLASIGTTEEELIQLDEQHSIDNYIEVDGGEVLLPEQRGGAVLPGQPGPGRGIL